MLLEKNVEFVPPIPIIIAGLPAAHFADLTNDRQAKPCGRTVVALLLEAIEQAAGIFQSSIAGIAEGDISGG